MENRVVKGTQAGKTGLSFTGNRQPVYAMPIPLRQMVRKWCNINGVFMSQEGDYITWAETENGKDRLIKLYLNYHKTQTGKEIVIASNARIQRSINVTGLMGIEHAIQNMGLPESVMQLFNANILGDD